MDTPIKTGSFTEDLARWLKPEPFHALARQTGFVRRQGKIDPHGLLFSAVLGQASALLLTLNSQAQSLAVPVSRQAIPQRYTPKAVAFFRAAHAHVKSVVLRKVAYRMAGKPRLVWAFVLAQAQGLTLLFVQKPDDNYPHTLAIASEDSAGVFMDVPGANRFPLETPALDEIGGRLEALGDGLTKVDFRKLFKVDDD